MAGSLARSQGRCRDAYELSFAQSFATFPISALSPWGRNNQGVRKTQHNWGGGGEKRVSKNDVFPKHEKKKNSSRFQGCRNPLSAELFTKVCFKVTCTVAFANHRMQMTIICSQWNFLLKWLAKSVIWKLERMHRRFPKPLANRYQLLKFSFM